MTLCSATGGAVNQIQYWIEAEATGETTDVTYVEWTSTDGAGYEFMIQESAVIAWAPAPTSSTRSIMSPGRHEL